MFTLFKIINSFNVKTKKIFHGSILTSLGTFLSLSFLSIYLLFPLSVRAQDYIEDFLKPTKKNQEKEVTIIVKYKESNLSASDEKEKGVEATDKLQNIIGSSTEVITPAGVEETTEEKIAENKKKFPLRALRVPDNAIVPNLSLIKEIRVSDEEASELIEELQKNPNIEYVTKQEKLKPTSPNDPYYSVTHNISGSSLSYYNSEYLQQIGLGPTGSNTSGWDITTGSKTVVVAVFGQGIDFTHPDLEDNMWINPNEFPSGSFSGLDANSDGVVTLTELKTWSTHPLADYNSDGRIDLKDLVTTHVDNIFLNGVDDDTNGYVDDFMGWNHSGNNNVYDDGTNYYGHDTQVASIIGAVGNNGIGMTGVNWNVRLMAVKNFGVGSAIQYAADNGADVFNISYSGSGTSYKDYVDYAYANGMIVVYSADNDGNSTELGSYHSDSSDHTWVVGSTDLNEVRASYSNYGNRLDFMAPGSGVASLRPQDISGGIYNPIKYLTKDINGNPSLVYFDPIQDILRFGVKSSGSWSFETVDTSGIFNGIYPSLDFDSSNNPHISYYDWENRKLMYATKSGETWSTQTLTDSGDQGYGTSIAVDGSNHPEIAFIDCTNDLLKLKSYNGTSWEEETVGSSGSVDACDRASVSLVLDSSGNPNISFYDLSAQDLKFAVKSDDNWTVETVDSTGDAGKRNSLVLDVSDNPYIAYTSSSALKYATKSGGNWSFQSLTTGYSNTYYANSISLDSNNYPHIFATGVDTDNYVIKHFYYDGAAFQSENVGATSNDLLDSQLIMISGSTIPFGVATSYKKGFYDMDKTTGSWVVTNILPSYSNSFAIFCCTSSSAPQVAGLAALIISIHPTWTINQIYWAIASSAQDLGSVGHDQYYGWGEIDANAALRITEPLTDDTAPTASITYPIDEGEVDLGLISVVGSATDTNFTHYNLFYKAESDSTYTAVDYYDHSSKSGQTLGTWNTSELDYGRYDLKLEVSDWYQTTTYEETVNVGIDTNPPAITLATLAPTTDTTPVVRGNATDEMRVLSSAEFQMDSTSGNWTACTADDGAYDESTEGFYCSITSDLTEGTHIIYVRTTDSKGNISTGANIASMNVFIGEANDFSNVIENDSNISTTYNNIFKNIDGTVRAIETDATHVYVGGDFTSVGDYRGNVGVVNTSTAAANISFPEVLGGIVYTIVSDGAGGWYLGGTFTNIGGNSINYLAHINSDNTVDTTWSPNPNNYVYTIAVSGSDIYVGGNFSKIGGATRNRIAKLNNTTGAADGSWDPNAGSAVNVITISGTDIFVGGDFTTIGGATRNRIAKLNNTTGAADGSWDPNATSGTIYTIAISGSDIYAGGTFTTIGGALRNRIAKLNNTTGAADETWNGNANNSVYIITISDTDIYVGGKFTSIGGQTRRKAAKLNNTTGAADGTWNPNVSSTSTYWVSSLIVTDSNVFIGGTFASVNSVSMYKVAKLNKTNGVMDATWNAQFPTASSTNGVRALALSGSNLYVGGEFTFVANRTTVTNLVRFNLSDNSLDTSWLPNITSPVLDIEISGTDVYVAGQFTFTGVDYVYPYVVKFNSSDGSLDTSWRPRPSAYVSKIIVENNDVYLVGIFTTINSTSLPYVARVNNSDGAPDTSWTPNPNNSVYALDVSGSNIYAGGSFTNIGGVNIVGLAKLSITDGSAIESWNPNIESGQVARLSLINDDVVAAGYFKVNSLNRALARFDKTTAAVDSVWTFSVTSSIYDFFKSGPYLYVGGNISSINGKQRKSVARINYDTGALDDSWTPDFTLATSSSPIVYTFYNTTSGLYVGGLYHLIDNIPKPAFSFFSNYNLVISESGYVSSITEGGSADTITIALTKAPTSNVTLNITTTEDMIVSPAELVFNTSNWSTAQTVSVSILDDSTQQGNRTGEITFTPVSVDSNYDGIVLNSLNMTIVDKIIGPVPIGTSTSTSSSGSSSEDNTPPGPKAPWLYFAQAQSSDSIYLIFAEANGPIDRYILEYGTKPNEFIYSAQSIGGEGTRTYLVKSLSQNTTYYFRIRAGHGKSVGSWSNVMSATTKQSGLSQLLSPIITDSDLTNNIDTTCSSLYIVKANDTLWNIAQNLLGNGTRYAEILNSNLDTHPSLKTSNMLKIGWDLKIPCSDSELNSSRHILTIKTVDSKKRPLPGVKITIEEKSQEGITNEEGTLKFSDLDSGDYKINLFYKNIKEERLVNISKESKDVVLDVELRTDSKFITFLKNIVSNIARFINNKI